MINTHTHTKFRLKVAKGSPAKPRRKGGNVSEKKT